MKKSFLILFALILCTCLALFATSCTKIPRPPKPETSIESTTESKPLPNGVKVEFNTLTSNGTEVYGKVSNSTTEFDFKEEISISRANFVISSDPYGKDTFFAKKIPLELGDNSVYLFITIDDEIIFTYNVTIHRRPTYNVTFDSNGGTAVASQIIEEDCLATEPQTPTKVGYTFTGWDYDFTQPISGNTEITASWVAIANTPYKVEYYLQNFDGDYELDHTDSLQGETDTTATAQIKTFDHFAFNENASTLSGNISGDGNLVLRLYYTRINYEIRTMTNNSQAGKIVGSGTYCYGKQITLSATPYLGYTFVGWYDGETLASKDAQFTFVADKHVGLVAIFEVKPEMISFNFTSTTTTCTITGIKDMTVTEIVIPDCVTSIDGWAFYYCSSLTSITIPDVTSIGDHAFYNCSKLQYNIEGNLKYLGNANNPYLYLADTTSTSITSAAINDNCKFIGSSAFEDCSKLTSITIPDSVTSIDYWAFKECSSLTSVVIPNSVTSIGNYAFSYCDNLTSITIPDSVTSIGDYTFCGCSSLTSVVIGESVTYIGDGAFYNCSHLTSVVIPDSVTYIGEHAFFSCSHLTSVVIGDSVTYIGEYAFRSCRSLTSVVIGDSVTSIGNYAFSYCSSLTSIVIPDSVTSIGEDAFSNCWSLTNITVDINNTAYKSIDGNLYTKDGKTLIQYAIGKTATSFIIPDSVTSIGDGAFSGCSSLTSVVIGDSVTSIGDYAFYNCSSLTSINVSENNTAYKSIDGNLYTKDGKILIQYAIGKTATSFIIPDSVTSIGNYAFYSCSSLTSVVIPDSVTSIGDYAFSSCSSLTSIKYRGTQAQWNAISKNDYWDYNTGSYTITYNYNN